MPTCFVIMGFGKKTDYRTGRVLDLDASYRNMIKPAVEAADVTCVRADEIVHSGVIDVPMYEQIFSADVVVADLSTANSNAFYELGVRHAMRPYTTIIIAEDQFVYPFDVNHTAIRTYKHLGEDIGVGEAKRFSRELTQAIKRILAEPQPDSPVYTYLPRLQPPAITRQRADAAARAALMDAASAMAPSDASIAVLREQVRLAQSKKEWATAISLLGALREMLRPKDGDMRQEDPYIVQQLALLTYKSAEPTKLDALQEARKILEPLGPKTSNDTETLGLWGAVHKRLWEITGDREHLDESVRAYERGFYLRNDYYNGINLAFLLNVRSANGRSRAESIADFVQAERVRLEVMKICEPLVPPRAEAPGPDSHYWILATWAEALIGTGDEANGEAKLAEARALKPQQWMIDSTNEQLDKLRPLLASSPLRFIE